MISHMLLSKAISPSKHYKHCYPNYLVTYGSFFPFLPSPTLYNWGNRPETCVLVGICLEPVEHLSAKWVNHPHNQMFCLYCLTLVFSPLWRLHSLLPLWECCPLLGHHTLPTVFLMLFTSPWRPLRKRHQCYICLLVIVFTEHMLLLVIYPHQTTSSTAEEYYPFPFPKIVLILKIECQVYSRC